MVVQEKYQKVLDVFLGKVDNKSVDFFAVLKMDEIVDKWSILLAASWITDSNRKETFDVLATAMVDNLNTEEIDEIARVAVINSNNHLIQLFLKNFETGQHIKEDAQVNGNVIHEGYVLTAEAAKESNQKTML
jgi:hypothetical protein